MEEEEEGLPVDLLGLGPQKAMVVSSSMSMVCCERPAAEKQRRRYPPYKETRLRNEGHIRNDLGGADNGVSF